MNIVERCVQPLCEIERVRAGLLLNAQHDCSLGIVRAFAALQCRAYADLSNVADENGPAFARRDSNLSDRGY